MDNKEFESNIKRSLQVMLYIYQTKHGRNSDPKISNLHFHWFGEGNCEVTFDTEYKFEVEDPDVGTFMVSLNECDDKQQSFFIGIEILENGEFGKRVTPFEDSDDMIGYFKSTEYGWGYGAGECLAKFSYSYNYFSE